MQSKDHKPSSDQSSQIKIEVSPASTVDFYSDPVKRKLYEVKKQVKSVLEGANIDPHKLNFNFTV